MQLSMAPNFSALAVTQISVKHSKMRNFTFDAPWPEKTKEHRLDAKHTTTAAHFHV